MKYFKLLIMCLSILGITNVYSQSNNYIKSETINTIIQSIKSKNNISNTEILEKGVKQAAYFWNKNDGSEIDFQEFCIQNYITKVDERELVFQKISNNLEILLGNYNKISVDLKLPLHLDMGNLLPVDEIFGSYDVSSHFNDDMFNNKLAFITILNFPFYTLQEKNTFGKNWTRLQWAYARLGDLFTSRVPAELLQKVSQSQTEADTYISDYNIYMGKLIDNKGKSLFPADMKLITHWGLRDELKSNYSAKGLEKQQMIYEVMKHIILQDIPTEVINKDNYLEWVI